MKSIMQVAQECGLRYNDLYALVKRESIVCHKINARNFINKYQEDYLQRVLFYEGKIKEITLESKINSQCG